MNAVTLWTRKMRMRCLYRKTGLRRVGARAGFCLVTVGEVVWGVSPHAVKVGLVVVRPRSTSLYPFRRL